MPLLVLVLAAFASAQERPATLADALREQPRLAEITELLDTSGLLDQLAGPVRLTFFAPSDAAMARLDPEVREILLRDRGALDLIVRHHLVMGASPLTALRRLDAVTTLEGTQLAVRDDIDRVRVGGVRLVGDGVVTDNGVLYVVDRVLLPAGSWLMKDLLAGPDTP
jgi:uncharacterized surface protein with fasciclin (FAS1) repeats